MLSSFPDTIHAAVIGASGGLGQAFVQRLQVDPQVHAVTALSRSGTAFDDAKVVSAKIDLCEEASIKAAAAQAAHNKPLSLLIVASGLLHRGALRPEKNLRDLDAADLAQSFAHNTIGPALIIKHFLPLLPRRQRAVIACLSARVSSIADNQLGGWYGYRASKAALNMVIKTAAIEAARRYPQACLIGLHPGTVDTALSKPFQSQVPAHRLFTPDHSVTAMLQVIDKLQPADSGGLFAWDGQPIAY